MKRLAWLTMAALAVLFFDYLYAGVIGEGAADEYIAGLILLGAAPCTASPTRCTRRSLVEPAIPGGDPEITTTLSPTLARSCESR